MDALIAIVAIVLIVCGLVFGVVKPRASTPSHVPEKPEYTCQARCALIREHIEHAYPGRWRSEPIDEAVRHALRERLARRRSPDAEIVADVRRLVSEGKTVADAEVVVRVASLTFLRDALLDGDTWTLDELRDLAKHAYDLPDQQPAVSGEIGGKP